MIVMLTLLSATAFAQVDWVVPGSKPAPPVNVQDASLDPPPSQTITIEQLQLGYHPDSVAADANTLQPFDLAPNQGQSADEISLVYQADGNLVLLRNNPNGTKDIYWSTGTSTHHCASNCRASFQADGNLVLYDNGKSYWNSGTNVATPGSMFVMMNRPPFIAITGPMGAIRWSPPTKLTWFSALDNVMNYGAGRPGEADYLSLFADDFSWSQHMKNVSVIKLYAQFVDVASDDQLKQVFATLKKNHVGLAIESCMASLGSNGCGIDAATNYGIEGYCMSSDVVAARAARIKNLGGDLAYVSIDEVFGANHHPNSCHQSWPDLATNAAGVFNIYQSQFPMVQIGDIENVYPDQPRWYSDFFAWIDSLGAATGKPLAFVHGDLAWNVQTTFPGWDRLRADLGLRQTPYGVIFNAKTGLASNEAWIQSAKDNLMLFLSQQAPPDHAVFQSWDSFPTKALPETDLGAHANLVAFYDVVGASGTHCANEGENCGFKGTRFVRYGVPGHYSYQMPTDGVGCGNAFFNGDPAPNILKSCDLLTTH